MPTLPRTPFWLSLLTLWLVALLALPQPARAQGNWWNNLLGKAVQGSGKTARETRTPGEFKAIRLEGSINLVLRQGERDSVELSADDNLLPLLQTELEGETLVVRWRKGAAVNPRSETKVLVVARQVNAVATGGSGDIVIEGMKTASLALTVNGSGDVAARQLATEELQISIRGSGDVSAEGTSQRLAVSIAGSGDVKASQLKAEAVKVQIAGSGNAQVNAARSLAVTIAGSGDVAYLGNPTAVASTVHGSGTVRKQ